MRKRFVGHGSEVRSWDWVAGVVPLSLCRNGNCGVSASSSGVRLDVDEEEAGFSGHGDPTHEGTQPTTNQKARAPQIRTERGWGGEIT